jgi:hypothetical protein
MLFRKGFFVFIFSLISFFIESQITIKSDSALSIKDWDSIQTIPRNGLKATELIVATNMSVWSMDRFAFNADYARINIHTIKDNFKTGFVWDNDMFITNLFAHPYHGGLYFNAARSSGMNFWQSVPFAAGGSLMWEFCMENESPAINDFLSTSIGGSCLGELTFRISDMIVDDRTRGFNRFKREALLTLVSPIRGLNRIINGEAWKHRNTKGNSIPSTPVTFYVALGHRIIADYVNNKHDISNMASFDLGFYYGDPCDPDNEKPYDFFVFEVGGNLLSIQPIIGRVNALGMLYSRNIRLRKPNHQLTWGLYQHFNYYESKADINHVSLTPYKLSEAASFGPGLLYKINKKKHTAFLGSAYLSAILLGGSQTDHYSVEDRDYNMGSGFSSKVNLIFQFGNKAILSMDSEDYRIYSWVGYDPNHPEILHKSVQGDKGNASLSVGRLSFNYLIGKHFSLGIESSFYYRKSVYDYYPEVEHGVTENKVMVGYLF